MNRAEMGWTNAKKKGRISCEITLKKNAPKEDDPEEGRNGDGGVR